MPSSEETWCWLPRWRRLTKIVNDVASWLMR
jgi:hypothetical protein